MDLKLPPLAPDGPPLSCVAQAPAVLRSAPFEGSAATRPASSSAPTASLPSVPNGGDSGQSLAPDGPTRAPDELDWLIAKWREIATQLDVGAQPFSMNRGMARSYRCCVDDLEAEVARLRARPPAIITTIPHLCPHCDKPTGGHVITTGVAVSAFSRASGDLTSLPPVAYESNFTIGPNWEVVPPPVAGQEPRPLATNDHEDLSTRIEPSTPLVVGDPAATSPVIHTSARNDGPEDEADYMARDLWPRIASLGARGRDEEAIRAIAWDFRTFELRGQMAQMDVARGRAATADEVQASAARMMQKHRRSLERLADVAALAPSQEPPPCLCCSQMQPCQDGCACQRGREDYEAACVAAKQRSAAQHGPPIKATMGEQRTRPAFHMEPDSEATLAPSPAALEALIADMSHMYEAVRNPTTARWLRKLKRLRALSPASAPHE